MLRLRPEAAATSHHRGFLLISVNQSRQTGASGQSGLVWEAASFTNPPEWFSASSPLACSPCTPQRLRSSEWRASTLTRSAVVTFVGGQRLRCNILITEALEPRLLCVIVKKHVLSVIGPAALSGFRRATSGSRSTLAHMNTEPERDRMMLLHLKAPSVLFTAISLHTWYKYWQHLIVFRVYFYS